MMMGMNFNDMQKKMMDRFFKKVDDAVWDLMTGKAGLQTKNGIATLEGEGEEATVNINPVDQFGMPVPAFAQNTSVDQIAKGDLIYEGKQAGWVVEVPEEDKKTFKLLRVDGSRGEWKPPKYNSIGLDLNGAMVLRSLMNTLSTNGLGDMQNNLMPLLMMGGTGDEDLEKMIPMMLMMQTGMGGMNTGDSGDSNNMNQMMQMMLMSKMFGGKNTDTSTDNRTKKSSFFDM